MSHIAVIPQRFMFGKPAGYVLKMGREFGDDLLLCELDHLIKHER